MAPIMKTDEHKTNVQERILNGAEELFASSSYSATRISDIAAKAGVNQAMVHYYFDTKEKLYQAVLERLFRQWESYLEQQSWENVHPEQVLRQYVKSHFEIKCKIPNLYKIFHKEALEGSKLFDQYASAKWFQDFLDKSRMFTEWKQAGIINPHVNEQVVLFCLWGMMNQFYYRDEEALAMITGHSGSIERLQDEIADQMVALAQHGLLAHSLKTAEPLATSSVEPRVIHLFYDESALGTGTTNIRESSSERAAGRQACSDTNADDKMENPPQDEDVSGILEMIQSWQGCTVRLCRSVEAWRQETPRGKDLLFLVTSSTYGELSASTVKLLQELEANSSIVADRFVAIWTKRRGPASDAVQQLLEETINRFGGFAISRIAAHTVHGYLNRCAKMTGI